MKLRLHFLDNLTLNIYCFGDYHNGPDGVTRFLCEVVTMSEETTILITMGR